MTVCTVDIIETNLSSYLLLVYNTIIFQRDSFVSTMIDVFLII